MERKRSLCSRKLLILIIFVSGLLLVKNYINHKKNRNIYRYMLYQNATLMDNSKEASLDYRKMPEAFEEEKSSICDHKKMEKIQEERNKTLKQVCSTLAKKYPKLQPDRLYVDENRKILGCFVPKTMSSSLKALFLYTTEKYQNELAGNKIKAIHEEGLAKYGIHHFEAYDQDQKEYVLENYFKFIFIRHPFHRLYSAYVNKFVADKEVFPQMYGKFIIKKYRKNPTSESLEKGEDVSFSEFVSYILDSNEHSNPHWELIQQTCWPCHFNYTFIGHHESLNEDQFCLQEHLTSSPIQFPSAGESGPWSSKQYLKNLNISLSIEGAFSSLSEKQLEDLSGVYAIDCKMFGYNCNSDFLIKPFVSE